MEIPAAKVPSIVKDFGNCSSASIPLTLTMHSSARAARTVVCGFGSGLSWTGALLALDRTHFSPLQELKGPK
jgi:3-oxoacyl-[acyl-carrier-protein] synthase III